MGDHANMQHALAMTTGLRAGWPRLDLASCSEKQLEACSSGFRCLKACGVCFARAFQLVACIMTSFKCVCPYLVISVLWVQFCPSGINTFFSGIKTFSFRVGLTHAQ